MAKTWWRKGVEVQHIVYAAWGCEMPFGLSTGPSKRQESQRDCIAEQCWAIHAELAGDAFSDAKYMRQRFPRYTKQGWKRVNTIARRRRTFE